MTLALRTITATLCICLTLCLGRAKADEGSKLAPLVGLKESSNWKFASKPPRAEMDFLVGIAERRAKGNAAFSEAEMLDAMIWASGVGTDRMQAYRERYAELRKAAAAELRGARNVREKGERLLKFLHRGPMNKGYRLTQTSLAEILDTGTYNCVSSAGLYYLLGSAFELKMKAISIEGSDFVVGHAAVDLWDGEARIQVEPTHADGFDWETKSKQPGFVAIGPSIDRSKACEADGMAIAAMIYANRAAATKVNSVSEQADAVRWCFSGLALAPDDRGSLHNLGASLTNWGLALIEAGEYASAIEVLEFGSSNLTEANKLLRNLKFAWQKQIDALLESGNDASAVKAIAAAKNRFPSEPGFLEPIDWFCRLAQTRESASDWEGALAIFRRAQDSLSANVGLRLTERRDQMFRRWSQSFLKNNEFDRSAAVLSRALELSPDSRDIEAGIAFHTQEALETLHRDRGIDAAANHWTSLSERFPRSKSVGDIGWNFVMRTVHQQTSSGNFEMALQTIGQLQRVERIRDRLSGLKAAVHAERIRLRINDGAFEDAYTIFAEAILHQPEQDAIIRNGVALFDRWADQPIRNGDWDEAIRIYRKGLEALPGDSHLQNNLRFCESKKDRSE
jgi:tetratricopeptide (TPR) repeat protein